MFGNIFPDRRLATTLVVALAIASAISLIMLPANAARAATKLAQTPLARAVELVEQAKISFGRRNWARTIELSEQAARIDPGYSRPYVYIGLAREQQRRPDLARAAYLKVLALIPTQALSDPRRREDLAMARRRLKMVTRTQAPSQRSTQRNTPRTRPTPAASRLAIVPSPMKLQWKGEMIALSITPVLQRGNLMVPFGDVFKAAGGQTSYDALTRSVTAVLPTDGARPQTTIRIVINRSQADVNGKTVALDAAALDYRDYAMVPLTFVTAVLHAQPEYDFGAELINIRPKSPNDTLQTPSGITAARVFSPAALKEWHIIPAAHASGVRTLAWSPDGKLLASGGADKTVKLWSMPAATLKTTLPPHGGEVRSIAFSPDGSTLASGSADNLVRLWDAASGTLKKSLPPHGGEVRAVAFSPDGNTLASGSADKTVKLWNASSGDAKATLNFPAAVDALAWSLDAALLAVAISEARTGIAGEGEVRLISAASGVQSASPLISRAESVAFSPDNRTWASTDGTFPVALRDRNTPVQRVLSGLRRGASALAFSRDGKWIASGGSEKIVRISKVAGANVERELPALSASVQVLAFSPDGFALAIGSADGSIRLWRME